MSENDLFSAANRAQSQKPTETQDKKTKSNVAELSVSDLANGLKKTLEDVYGHIRVRGELSGIKIAGSGHLYGDIKDENANINIVCWRGVLSKLDIRPEDGMDVIVTGKVSSYPKSSRYQIVIDRLELAGEGALLKLLEERKRKLAAEGLFSAERKKKLPFLPRRIGIVTSPTGAVIRDILHRLQDRFPRPVLLWPVAVQGTGAADQIADAIRGFNTLPESIRPDLLIVARGGGSLEDLMAFNEENVVRAVAESHVPVISAVGHETDTSLCDYAADLRAPTPTGAAEMAVPVRDNLRLQVEDDTLRLKRALWRQLKESREKVHTLGRHLGQPERLLESRMQSTDYMARRLDNALRFRLEQQSGQLQKTAGRLIRPDQVLANKTQFLKQLTTRFQNAQKTQFDRQREYAHKLGLRVRPPHTLVSVKKDRFRTLEQRVSKQGTLMTNQRAESLSALSRLLESFSPKSALQRGFAILRDENGRVVRQSDDVADGQIISAELHRGETLHARVEKQ